MRFITSPFIRRTTRLMPAVLCAASVCLLGSAATAAADEFMPAATLTVDATCVDGSFHLDIVMGNVAGLDTAHFIASLNTGNTGWNAIAIDVPAGTTDESHLTSNEGSVVSVHITSADAVPAIDYTLTVTADCVEDTTIPETTIPETTLETTVVDSSGGGLPSTGGSSWLMAGMASALLLAGITLARGVRRA